MLTLHRDTARRSAGGLRTTVLLLNSFWLLLSPCPAGASPPALPGAFDATHRGSRRQEVEAPELLPGQAVELECAGGERHAYRLSLKAEQYLRVVVEQRGIDLLVRLIAPDGRQLVARDSPNGAQGPEVVSIVAGAAGEYRLEVRAVDEKAAPGRYELKVDELRDATGADRRRVANEWALAESLAEANRLRARGTREALQQAAEKLDEALPLLRAAEDRRGEAQALYDAGLLYWKLGQNRKSLDYHQRALGLRREARDRKGESASLYLIGLTYWQMGDGTRALEYYGLALPLMREAGGARGEGVTLSAMGAAFERMGRLREALDHHSRSLALLRAAGKPGEVANALSNIGVVYRRLGDLQKAFEHYAQALSLLRGAGDRQGEGVALNNIGVLFWQLGDGQRALDYYQQALPLRRATGDRAGEINTLANLASAYGTLGDSQKALDHYGQVLALVRASGDRWTEAATLHNIGAAYGALGDSQKALDHYDRALTLRRAVGDRSGEAFTLSQIGVTYSSLGRPEEALGQFLLALPLHRAVSDQVGEAGALKNIARAERDLGRLAEARAHIEAAVKLVEGTRARFVSPGLRTSFSASRQEYYELYIDVLMLLHRGQPSAGHDAAALQVSELARARSLVELLTEAGAEIRRGVEPALLERGRSLQQRLNAAAEDLTRLGGGKDTEGRAAAMRNEVRELLGQYQEVEAQIRAESPHYAALTQPRPLSPGEVQRELDEGTLLLEYALGDERSYLWAVTPTSVKSFELPGRAVIEAAARQVYQHLVAKSDALYPEALAALGRALLGPVSEQLGRKRLIVVADGALQYVPFGALPSPAAPAGKNAPNDRARPMIAEHEIASLPSASVIAALRREVSARKAAPRKLAVIADPVFDQADRRVKPRPAQTPGGGPAAGRGESGPGLMPSHAERSAGDVGLADFVRLPLSRREAELITGLLPEGQSLRALDFAANRATATGPELGTYQIVHFATHSLINTQHPELSGIVLSLVNERGATQDGFLRLHDIYNLKLEADLVVLSGCRTALGKEIRGEGLVGLTRGFMYAGAPRVVASLWEVSDSATAELMGRFYRNMIHGGLRPAAALRAAQTSLSREKQWEAPYYWAGFVLQGEWR